MQTGDCRELESAPGDSYFVLHEPHGRVSDIGIHPTSGQLGPDLAPRPNRPRTLGKGP